MSDIITRQIRLRLAPQVRRGFGSFRFVNTLLVGQLQLLSMLRGLFIYVNIHLIQRSNTLMPKYVIYPHPAINHCNKRYSRISLLALISLAIVVVFRRLMMELPPNMTYICAAGCGIRECVLYVQNTTAIVVYTHPTSTRPNISNVKLIMIHHLVCVNNGYIFLTI